MGRRGTYSAYFNAPVVLAGLRKEEGKTSYTFRKNSRNFSKKLSELFPKSLGTFTRVSFSDTFSLAKPTKKSFPRALYT